LTRSKLIIDKSADQIKYLLKSYKETAEQAKQMKIENDKQKDRLTKLQQRFNNMIRGHANADSNDQAAMLEEMMEKMKNEMESLQKENERLKHEADQIKKDAESALLKAKDLNKLISSDNDVDKEEADSIRDAVQQVHSLVAQHETIKQELEEMTERNQINMTYMAKLHTDFKNYQEKSTKTIETLRLIADEHASCAVQHREITHHMNSYKRKYEKLKNSMRGTTRVIVDRRSTTAPLHELSKRVQLRTVSLRLKNTKSGDSLPDAFHPDVVDQF